MSGKVAVDLIAGTFMYFAYGSNLLKERIIINNPSAKFHGIGTLHGYRFTYDAPTAAVGYQSDYWMGATATIRQASPADYVCGIIWEISNNDLEALDTQEVLYQPIEVSIENHQGKIIKCRTYEMDRDTVNDTKPSPHYKKVILAGARQNKLPEEYIRFLESFPDNGLTQTPPLYQKVIDTVNMFREKAGNEQSTNHYVEAHDFL